MSQTTIELAWLKTLFGELKIDWFGQPAIWCDNMSAAALSANSVFHGRTKHIEIDVHYIREQVRSKAVSIQYVPTLHWTANILTKASSAACFEILREKLGVAERTEVGDIKKNEKGEEGNIESNKTDDEEGSAEIQEESA